MKIFDKTRIQANELYEQVYEFVTNKFDQSSKVFTLSSAYGQILYVLTQIADMILFFIEDSITELNINTATRTDSIQGLARLAGHDATRAIASTGEISFKITKIPEMQGDQIVISNFSRLKCTNNGKIYTLNLIDDQIRLKTSSTTSIAAQVMQGEIFSQTFTSDGTSLQSYTATVRGSVLIDNFFVKVYVNSSLWTKYDSLYDMSLDETGYLVKTGINGGIDIYFGNSYFGKIPELGAEIKVEYLQTTGEGGNLREEDSVTFEWIDNGYSLTGEDVDLNDALTTTMSKLISFGSNPEPTALTRLIAPKTSRSFVFANPENYMIFLEKFNYFSVIDAYNTSDDDYLDDDNIIYLFLVPDISKRIQNSENYFTVSSDYFTLTDQEKEKVINLIEDSGSKIVTTVEKIIDPIIKRYIMNISLIVFEGYSQDVIKSTIISNLSTYFLSNRRRDLIPLSDLVKLIENISGVDSVNVSFLSEENEISKNSNPDADLVGLDDMGNIIMDKDELCIIRGGWTDRNGIYYEDGIYDEKACSVNITIKKTTTETTNIKIFQKNMKKIMNG